MNASIPERVVSKLVLQALKLARTFQECMIHDLTLVKPLSRLAQVNFQFHDLHVRGLELRAHRWHLRRDPEPFVLDYCYGHE